MKRFTVAGIVLCLSIFALAAVSIAADKTGAQKAQETKVAFTGKIGYMKNVDAYVVKGENPPDEVFVVNPNKKVLEGLYKSQVARRLFDHFVYAQGWYVHEFIVDMYLGEVSIQVHFEIPGGLENGLVGQELALSLQDSVGIAQDSVFYIAI